MSKRYRVEVRMLVVVMLSASGVLAGDLTPPGPPGATMRTLQEIYEKLEDIDAKIEGGGGAVPKTGQTTPYRTGDDADLEKGMAWPNPRFTDHGNGTVTDHLTGLMWVKAPHDLHGNSEAMIWNSAIDFCNGLSFAGHSDWRLPNVRELHSLIDYGSFNPALPPGNPFSEIHWGFYWSSTTYADNADDARCAHLGHGDVEGNCKTTSMDSSRVWPVRAGQ